MLGILRIRGVSCWASLWQLPECLHLATSAGESVVSPRSRCPQCGAPIRWYDNIPVLSWVRLRAAAGIAKLSIPWRYPVVELALGCGFSNWRLHRGTFFGRAAPPFRSLSCRSDPILELRWELAILGFLLIGLMVMDWQTMLLPDSFTLSGIAIGLLSRLPAGGFSWPGGGSGCSEHDASASSHQSGRLHRAEETSFSRGQRR